jgi:hypothetical protein
VPAQPEPRSDRRQQSRLRVQHLVRNGLFVVSLEWLSPAHQFIQYHPQSPDIRPAVNRISP